MEKYSVEQLRDPVDSSMMVGAFRAIDGIEDALPYFNAPLGCSFHILLMWSRHNRDTLNPYQSMIQEGDVIMGMDKKLEESLLKTVESQRDNKVILIVSSDAAEIISPNVEEVARKVMDQTGHSVRILPLQSAGIKGDHVDGFNEVMVKLFSNFPVSKKKRMPNTVNLLGVVQDEITARGDVREVRRMLDAIGVQVLSAAFLDSSTDQITRICEGALNIVLHEEYGREGAELLEKQFGIPFLCAPPPFGVEGTRDWLIEVGRHFDKVKEAEQFIAQEEARIYPRIVQADQYLTGRKVAIYADPAMAVGLTRLCAEMGMIPVLTAFSTKRPACQAWLEDISQKYGISPEFLEEDNINFKSMAREIKPEVIFGCGFHYELSVELNAFHYPINYPTSQRLRVYDIPVMGYQGLLYTVQQVGDEMLRRDLFDETVHDADHVREMDAEIEA